MGDDCFNDEPTLFSLFGVNIDIEEEILQHNIARALQIQDESSVSILEMNETTVLFFVEQSCQHISDDTIIERLQTYINSLQAGNDVAKATTNWLNPTKASITMTEMEEEISISEEEAYQIWLQEDGSNTNHVDYRTSHLQSVRSPDGDIIQPSHHNVEFQEAPITQQLKRDPTLLVFDNVPRVSILSNDFHSLAWNEPVVLTGIAPDEVQNSQAVLQSLITKCADVIVRTGNRETLIENGFHHSAPIPLKDALQQSSSKDKSLISNCMVFSPFSELPKATTTDFFDIVDKLFSLRINVLKDPKYTLCIANEGFGIGMHNHGPALFWLLEGRKKWYLSQPETIDQLDATTSTHPQFYQDLSSHKCIQMPGECLFVPDHWYHEIFNIFSSTGIQLLSEQVTAPEATI